MLYSFVILLILFFWIKSPKVKTKIDNNLYTFLCFLLILIAGLRYNLGIDTYRYTAEFESFPRLNELSAQFIQDSRYQILWILFESTVKTVFNSMYMLQLLLAAFVNITVFWYVKKNSRKPYLIILFYFILFYFNLNMEILRESIAVCILLIGLDLLKQKRYIRYYLFAIIGFLFHESGIVLLLTPILFLINFKNKFTYLVYIILFVISSNFVIQLVINSLSAVDNSIVEMKIDYFDVDLTKRTLNTFIFQSIKYVFFPLICFVFLYKYLDLYERKYILLYLFFSVLFIQSPIFYRLRDYFFIPYAVSFVNAVFRIPATNNLHRPIKFLFIAIFLIISLFREYYNPIDINGYQKYVNYYPYNSFFDEELPYERRMNYKKIGNWSN